MKEHDVFRFFFFFFSEKSCGRGKEETSEMDRDCWGLGSRQLSPLSDERILAPPCRPRSSSHVFTILLYSTRTVKGKPNQSPAKCRLLSFPLESEMRFNPQAGPPGWFLTPVARRVFKWSATHPLLKIMLSLRPVPRSDVPFQGTWEALEVEPAGPKTGAEAVS